MRFVFKTSYDADIRLFKHNAQAFWYLLLFTIAILLPFLISGFLIGEATLVLIWAICGMGLMVLVGQTGQASLGHAAFMAVGAYSNVIYQESFSLPFLLAFPLSGLTAGLAGALVALPTTKLHGIYLAVATLAVSVMAEDLIVILEPITGGVAGMLAPDIQIFGLAFNRYGDPKELYWLILLITFAVIYIYRNLLRSPTGRAFAAVRDSEVSAKTMGINIARTKMLAFAISCSITGLGGALMGHFATVFTHETFNLIISITLLLMIVVGGLGTIHGAFFGAIVIVMLPLLISVTRDGIADLLGLSSITIPGIEHGLFGMMLVGFILFEPMGIYGRWIKIRTYFELFPFYRKDMFRCQKSYLKTERTR